MDYEANLHMSKSTQDHHLNKFGRPHIPNATYKSQDHRPSGSGKEDFLRGFTIYGCGGGHLGHVAKFIQNDSGHMTKMVITTSIYGNNH